ncbi:MAG: valine--tRNA ligase [Candidatus Paceibacteria bacterium]
MRGILDMDDKFLKPYNPQETEDKIYKLWEEGGFFRPEKAKSSETFSISLPPPNVTGTLHMGHAAMLAIEDILVRYNRMKGKKTLWLPGTDHAAIATQSKVEEILYKKEKKTRHDLGREEFLNRVEKFANESHDTIVKQIKKMGASVDWTREAFTLDEKRSLAVRTAFKKMHDDGLIYRGNRIVNWDPKMQSNVSDDEIERKEEKSPFYYLKYGPFEIGTARPETKFGDKYVVMHPDDKRYSKYEHGQKIDLEWINGPITATVVKDEVVDMEFGTGVMTITPWHDATDFEIAERHNLDTEQIIDFNGKLLPIAEEFAGIHIKKARPMIVEKLKEKGLVTKVDEDYVLNLATNYRGGGVIEPQIKEQWFVDVNKKFKLPNSKIKGIKSSSETSLKEIMRKTVESGQIEIIPKRFDKTYFHWIDKLRDWNISRQIWYGHRIPVWRKKQTGNITNPGKEEFLVSPEKVPDDSWEQDPDTLDTWFSSGLWTFSTLGWPEETEDMKNFHPTSVLETGPDILFFWVARMILMSGYLLGDIPFEKVYLHGIVLNKKGKKMSKSSGDIIDPLEMTEKYGADAARLSLIVGAPPGNDISLSEDKIRGYKNFANKIWNITRFVLSNIDEENMGEKPELSSQDKEWMKSLENITKTISDNIEGYRPDFAADEAYHFVWHHFADKYIEEVKPILENGSEKDKLSAKWTLYETLTTILKLLHPFAPFVTEEIWQHLPEKDSKMLIVAKWPQ